MKRKRLLGLVIIFVILIVLVIGLIRFVHHRLRYAVSNAVFVETDDLVFLAFQRVNGRILKLTRNEGEEVRKGEVLAYLDNAPYLAEVRRLEAQKEALQREIEAQEIFLEKLRREVELLEREALEETKRLEEEKSALEARSRALEAQISQLRRDAERLRRLYAKDLVPKHQLEETETRLVVTRRENQALGHRVKALQAAREAARQKLARARNRRREILQQEKHLAALEKQLLALKEALSAAREDLANCFLKSPIDGSVAKRFHTVGDVVHPGEPVLALVDPKKIYVLVLLEETKLHGVEVGCPAKIKIDAYPREKFEGEVKEILPATAAKFALVPRDVSAGEFTKVAQRVPVKIALTKGPVELLRVGLGGEVEIKRK